MRAHHICLATAGVWLAACGGDDDGLTTDPPSEVEMVASGGFDSPLDAVASPGGDTFYFTAFTTDEEEAALFSVPASGGEATVLHAGFPLEDPTGLVLSCDGSTLYVADIGPDSSELADGQSLVYAWNVDGGPLSAITLTGMAEAASLALGPDCQTLYATGYGEDGAPGLFRFGLDGGAATAILTGEPLQSPSGVFVDADRVAWVMDQLPRRGSGGALWAITEDGEASEVVSGLGLSEPAGVSLVAGGGTAVIANRTTDGEGQLLAVEIDSGDRTEIATSMIEPAGLRTAREAGVFAIADSDGDAIYRAR
jgi:DNA-binding beta-propeller fold protein YncE